MWWRRNRVAERVWIADAVLREMVAEARRHAPLETGGMLLGYEGVDPVEAVVTTLIGPGPTAEHAFDSFVPDAHWQQAELEIVYAESGRVTTYLGDWHSHPDGGPSPGRKDRRTARRVARSGDARAPHPLTIITASNEEDWLFAAYRFVGRSFRLLRISRF
jgi:integrative and conjugative element protein (TIGR02256 family)